MKNSIERNQRSLFSRAAMLLVAMLTVTTAWAQEDVNYIDANGNMQTVKATPLMGDGVGPKTKLRGWYVVNGDFTLNMPNPGIALSLSGDTQIILCDGCTLTINFPTGDAKNLGIVGAADKDLTIYGQSNGTGKLALNCSTFALNAINNVENLTVNGGTLDVRWAISPNLNPIAVSSFTINGGNVVAKRLANNQNGTEEEASGQGIHASTYNFNGGSVYSTYYNPSATVVFGKAFVSGSTLMSADNIAGMGRTTITPAANGAYHIVTVPDGVKATTGTNVAYAGNNRYFVRHGGSLTLSAVENGYTVSNVTATGGSVSGTTISNITGDISVTATVAISTSTVYSISYNLNGGSLPSGQSNPTSYTYNTPTFTLINPTRTGCDFKGWTGTGLNTATKTVTVTQGSSGDREYTANWSVISYSIIYNLNGGSLPYGYRNLYNITTSTFTLPTPTREGYTFQGWYGNADLTGQTITTIPQGSMGDVTLWAKWSINPDQFSQSGDTYTIHTAEGWNYFCDMLNKNTKGIFTGKTIVLGADITVSSMAGLSQHDFTGTFDGNHKTLTFNATPTDNYCAPFRYVQGTAENAHAVIKDLNVKSTITGEDYRHLAGLIALQSGYVDVTGCNVEVNISCMKGTNNPTDLYPAAIVSQANNTSALTISGCTAIGTIATDGKYAAGILGIVQKGVSIENCLSSVTINSSTSGDGTHGGLVASQPSNTSITIEGCVFNGKLLGPQTTRCGGFIGYRSGGATITNSIFAPAEVTVSTDGSATFARNTVDTYNSYYTTYFCDGTNYVPNLYDDTVSPAKWHNGKQARSVTAGTNVSIDAVALTGEATEYNVSGITAYSGGGILCGGNLYYGSGDQVSLTLSNTAASPGYQYGYTASPGTLDGTTLTMPDADVTISLGDSTVIDWATVNAGTQDDPYMIYNCEQLDLLAQRVNGSNHYDSNKYFKLGNDITYTHSTAWNAVSTEHNYTPIGKFPSPSSSFPFKGNFDGGGHTISGIRIYESGSSLNYLGLFGYTENANIHDLILADTRITGENYVGGIVGSNNTSTISRCHVANNVAIHALVPGAEGHGGIAGKNVSSTIELCTSAVQLSTRYPNCNYFGAIAGHNGGNINAKLKRNIAIGATVPALAGNTYGAIGTGGDLEYNYYTACTVAGQPNATGVGFYFTGYNPVLKDKDNSASPALRDDYYQNGRALEQIAALPATLDLGWGAGKYPLQLAGRTLYRDGYWNTLCLPFDVPSFAGTPLEGATVKTLTDSSFDSETRTLTLTFSDDLSAIEAGKPYIVKWSTPGDDIVNPVFLSAGNILSISAHTDENKIVTPCVTFRGYFDQVTLTGGDSSLFLGGNNMLYYPTENIKMGAFRAYFRLTIDAEVKGFVLDFNEDDATSLNEELRIKNEESAAAQEWYDLSGRKLNGKPSKGGIYINNGHKTTIK